MKRKIIMVVVDSSRGWWVVRGGRNVGGIGVMDVGDVVVEGGVGL